MKIRIISGAVIAAAALALPAVAHAATYQPVTVEDPAYNAESAPDEPSNTGIDITKVRGFRNDGQISIATTFTNLKRVNYSRRIVALIKPSDTNPSGRLVEFRTGPKGTINVALYTLDFKTESFRQITCAGVRASADSVTDKLTVVIPTACYPGAKAEGAFLFAQSAVYNSESWTPGPLTNETQSGQPDQQDNVSVPWQWTDGAPMKPLKRSLSVF